MNKLIIANWKLNPASVEEAEKLAKASDIEGLIICPPFPFLEKVKSVIKKAKLGAQNLFWEEKGAFTGEVSGKELKSVGAEYVIIGHSERRRLGETDEIVAKKIKAAADDGLIPILCVGESRAQRDASETEAVVKRQLVSGLSLIHNSLFTIPILIVAYEPIWAIGTGTPDTPENMLKMVKLIKETLVASGYTLNLKIIYGGSVNSQNAEEFLKHKEIDGALVGGASLISEEIKEIVKIANKYGKI